MILWFNNKISDIRLSYHPRFNLRNDSRFDIAKYTYASYLPLAPLISKYIFNFETADGFHGRSQEMEDFLKSIFPSDKLIIRQFQCTTLKQWREMQEEIEAIDDDLIYPAANEDHVFLDSSIDIFKRGLELIKQDPSPWAQIMTSDFSVFMRANRRLPNSQISECGNYISFLMRNSDSMRVIKKELFKWYLDQVPENKKIIRSESWNDFMPLPLVNLYAPTKEQCRHFDAYSFMHMPPSHVSPLEIPVDFFKGFTIRYGFDDIDPTCVNINPSIFTQKVEDPINGIDYRCTLEDIPLFWKPFIKEIIIKDNIDHEKMLEFRDYHMLNSTRSKFNFTYLGWFTENDRDLPPIEWFKNHFLSKEFKRK